MKLPMIKKYFIVLLSLLFLMPLVSGMRKRNKIKNNEKTASKIYDAVIEFPEGEDALFEVHSHIEKELKPLLPYRVLPFRWQIFILIHHEKYPNIEKKETKDPFVKTCSYILKMFRGIANDFDEFNAGLICNRRLIITGDKPFFNPLYNCLRYVSLKANKHEHTQQDFDDVKENIPHFYLFLENLSKVLKNRNEEYAHKLFRLRSAIEHLIKRREEINDPSLKNCRQLLQEEKEMEIFEDKEVKNVRKKTKRNKKREVEEWREKKERKKQEEYDQYQKMLAEKTKERREQEFLNELRELEACGVNLAEKLEEEKQQKEQKEKEIEEEKLRIQKKRAEKERRRKIHEENLRRKNERLKQKKIEEEKRAEKERKRKEHEENLRRKRDGRRKQTMRGQKPEEEDDEEKEYPYWDDDEEKEYPYWDDENNEEYISIPRKKETNYDWDSEKDEIFEGNIDGLPFGVIGDHLEKKPDSWNPWTSKHPLGEEYEKYLKEVTSNFGKMKI